MSLPPRPRHRRGARVALSGIALAACALIVGGCGKALESTSGGDSGSTGVQRGTVTTPAATGDPGTLTWALYRAPTTLDPDYAFDYPENTVVAELCDAVLRQAPDGAVEPGLATLEYKAPTTVVLHLRGGAKFWDGSPVTAEDVAYSLNRQRDPAMGGLYAGVFERVTSIAATGAEEVTIRMSKPDYWLRGELSAMPGMVIEKKYAEEKGKEYGTPKGGVMCSGPFELAEWKAGQVVRTVRNDNYWDPKLRAKTSEIDYRGISDVASLTSGLETGEISGTYLFDYSTLGELEANSDLTVTRGPSLETNFFIVTNIKGPLGDPRVRKALSLAFDRKSYIQAVYGGAAQVPRMPSNPGYWGYQRQTFETAWNEAPEPPVDLAKARRLVKEAGAEGKTIVIGTSTGLATVSAEADAWQAAAKEIGMNAKLQNVSAENYINYFIDPGARESIDAMMTTTYGDYADPAALEMTYVYPFPLGVQNFSGWKDPQTIATYRRAEAEPDEARRAAIDVEGERELMKTLPWIPVADPYTVLVTQKDLTGAPASFAYMQAPALATLGSAE